MSLSHAKWWASSGRLPAQFNPRQRRRDHDLTDSQQRRLQTQNNPRRGMRRWGQDNAGAERLPVAEVARRAGVSRPAVWRWQRRYGEEGIDSLLRDKTRKPGRAPLSTGVVAKVLAL